MIDACKAVLKGWRFGPADAVIIAGGVVNLVVIAVILGYYLWWR
ncbi:MAG: hypothetical protein AABY45_04740 [Deltaproteobacteria bacterium]|jgi:hypothetical protein